ncbi:protein PLASTID MOVEMENT IMPAIRED 2 isoform X2 [Vitis vinifera]|uniref:protein PLASTID MOVEMENT IMPAIRED 2 isoform X2 n=1 Tax=Vitis vinifera TaxID=29760 RepID=UPI00053F6C97|nr:protein PLASTID MOVEMENT IMPAIRED 2 isoform X2 [Vitis vinifera]|eukprot:XP_002281016.3 PREDICTED: protein PLASTID MOVEMENT IMPAIRED 2 isoform X2 [Vitis vinifera]
MFLVEMERGENNSRRRIGSFKADINMYGERNLEGSAALRKPHLEILEKPSSIARELLLARRDIGRFSESRRAADSMKIEAESELFNAKKTVRTLSSLINESKAKAKMQDLEDIKKPEKREEGRASDVGKAENYQYAEVMKEVELMKQELSKLKLDMASVLEEKSRAEKEIEAASSKIWSYGSSANSLKKEIEEANEDQVLVELARIEAVKELVAIEAQREKEANEFSSAMEKTRKKMSDIIQEIEQSKDLETKLSVTTSDIDVLQNELKLAKKIDKSVQNNDSLKHTKGSFRRQEGSETSALLQSVTEELKAAKKELASIKEEGFDFMSSMDVIREELKHVTEETARLKKTEEKSDLTVKNLNLKLLRAQSKLEATSKAEENARSIASNLTLTLEQLKTDAEAVKKERELISEETATINAEIQKTDSEIDLNEERLQSAMQELEAVKSSEAIALEKLQTVTEITMRARASASQQNSSIFISKFEYEYLTGHAVGAEEVADKMVAAAQAWIEALKASEKEILMQTEVAQREIRELRMEEEKQVLRMERSLSATKAVEGEIQNSRLKRQMSRGRRTENMQLQLALPKKSIKDKGNLTPARRAKLRKSDSPAIRHFPRSSSVNLKKRKKVMPSLAKFFRSKRKENVL